VTYTRLFESRDDNKRFSMSQAFSQKWRQARHIRDWGSFKKSVEWHSWTKDIQIAFCRFSKYSFTTETPLVQYFYFSKARTPL